MEKRGRKSLPKVKVLSQSATILWKTNIQREKVRFFFFLSTTDWLAAFFSVHKLSLEGSNKKVLFCPLVQLWRDNKSGLKRREKLFCSHPFSPFFLYSQLSPILPAFLRPKLSWHEEKIKKKAFGPFFLLSGEPLGTIANVHFVCCRCIFGRDANIFAFRWHLYGSGNVFLDTSGWCFKILECRICTHLKEGGSVGLNLSLHTKYSKVLIFYLYYHSNLPLIRSCIKRYYAQKVYLSWIKSSQ